jgi:hypothetical protein
MRHEHATTLTFRLWIAGDYDDAKRACREFCATEGACFAVSPACYVYTGGCEDGVVVTLINYPRFPSDHDALALKITRLADHLCARLFQQSYTIEGPHGTAWYSHREGE